MKVVVFFPVLLAPIASGAILINDTFDDSPPDTATTADDAWDPNDVAWANDGTNGTVALQSGVGFSGKALQNGGSNDKFRILSGSWGSTTTLANIGDTLSYSFKVRSNNTPIIPSVAAGHSGGLFNAAGQGYFFWVGVGGNTNLSLHYDDGTGSPANAYSGSGVTQLGSAVVGASIDTGGIYDATMTLERVASGIDVEVVFGLNGSNNTVSFTDTTSPLTSFTRAVNGIGDHSIDWRVDDVLVEFTAVPEPSAAFLAIASTILQLRRRR